MMESHDSRASDVSISDISGQEEIADINQTQDTHENNMGKDGQHFEKEDAVERTKVIGKRERSFQEEIAIFRPSIKLATAEKHGKSVAGIEHSIHAKRTLWKIIDRASIKERESSANKKIFQKENIAFFEHKAGSTSPAHKRMFKIILIKQRDVDAKLGEFLKRSITCIKSFIKRDEKCFEIFRNSVLILFEIIIEGYKKLIEECETAEKEGEFEGIQSISYLIYMIKRVSSKELSILTQLQQLGTSSSNEEFQIDTYSEDIDSCCLSIYVLCVNIILLCDSMTTNEPRKTVKFKDIGWKNITCKSGMSPLLDLYYIAACILGNDQYKDRVEEYEEKVLINTEDLKEKFYNLLNQIIEDLEIKLNTDYKNDEIQSLFLNECLTVLDEYFNMRKQWQNSGTNDMQQSDSSSTQDCKLQGKNYYSKSKDVGVQVEGNTHVQGSNKRLGEDIAINITDENIVLSFHPDNLEMGKNTSKENRSVCFELLKDENGKLSIKMRNLLRDKTVNSNLRTFTSPKTLEDALEHFGLLMRFKEFEESLEEVKRSRKSKEDHESYFKEFDKEMQKLSLKFHPDKVKNTGGSNEEVEKAQTLQAALNATRKVLSYLNEIFLQELDVDHKYGYFSKLNISSLGNEDEIESHIYEVLFKISLLSEIKQHNIVSEIQKFLIESNTCIRNYIESNESGFKINLNSAMYRLKTCITGYRKLLKEYEAVEKDCRKENIENISSEIQKAKGECSKQLALLEKLHKVAVSSVKENFQLFSSFDLMDDYFVLPFVDYINLILMCNAMRNIKTDVKQSQIALPHSLKNFWSSGKSSGQRESHLKIYIPESNATLQGLYMDAYHLVAFCCGNKLHKREVMDIMGSVGMNMEDIKDKFMIYVVQITEYLKKFKIEDYNEKSINKYLTEEFSNCMKIMTTFQEKAEQLKAGIQEFKKDNEEMWKEYNEIKKENRELNEMVEEHLKESRKIQNKVLVSVPEYFESQYFSEYNSGDF